MKKQFSIYFLLMAVLLPIRNIYLAQEKLIPMTSGFQFEVLIDGNPLEENIEIIEMEVTVKAKKSTAEIDFIFHGEKLDFKAMGRSVTIKFGYNSIMESAFTGKVTKHEIRQSNAEPLIITAECEGKSVKNKITGSPVISLIRGANVIEFQMEINDDLSLSGELLIEGMVESLVGNRIDLAGFGNQFDGQFIVNKLKHIVKDGNWTTKLFIERGKQN